MLTLLGYREHSGTYRHPSRNVVFVGDLIDRGPKQVEVYRLVRAMCEAGSARCVLGNHEFNAIGWAMIDPASNKPLRSHSEKNLRQHREFLHQVGGEGSPCHLEMIDWFKKLPLWIETPDLRVVHACWHEESRQAIAASCEASGRLTETGLVPALTKGTDTYRAVDVLLKGPEVDLPDSMTFQDKDGTTRRQARIRWWDPDAITYRTAAVVDAETVAQLPESELLDRRYIYSDRKPVFFGHYWLTGEPRLESSVAICLDYSVAKNGALVAYRWSGETSLRKENIRSVRVKHKSR